MLRRITKKEISYAKKNFINERKRKGIQNYRNNLWGHFVGPHRLPMTLTCNEWKLSWESSCTEPIFIWKIRQKVFKDLYGSLQKTFQLKEVIGLQTLVFVIYYLQLLFIHLVLVCLIRSINCRSMGHRRAIYKTLWNISHGAFCENSWWLKAIHYFRKTLQLRCLTGLWKRLCIAEINYQ